MSEDGIFDRVKAAYVELISLSPEAREARLSALRSEDAAIAAEVERLLDADAEGETLEVGEVVTRPSVSRSGVAESESESVEGYEIVRPIGSGGFGVVYEGRQVGEIRRPVALKVLHGVSGIGGSARDRLLARFRAERQALAAFDHPAIATILDAGVTSSGRPYFAMELVPGAELTTYCDAANLSLRERIELVLDACDALEHAHQRGVIHRDLKPSNILAWCDERGRHRVKVIDFGVAKSLDEPLVAEMTQTEAGVAIGTPAYMSPEQAGASDVDIRTDVYGMGAVIGELLFGVHPIAFDDLRGLSRNALYRVLSESERLSPSRALAQVTPDAVGTLAGTRGTSAESLRRAAASEAGWIVTRATRCAKEERYRTIGALSDDLRRHLRGDAVQAGPETWSYRARKYVRRHWLGVSVASVVVLALLGGIAGLTSGYVLAERGRTQAREVATIGTTFADGLFEDVSPKLLGLDGAGPARSAFIEQGVAYLESLERAAAGASDAGATALSLARGYRSMGALAGGAAGPNEGDHARAIALHQRAMDALDRAPSNNETAIERFDTLLMLSDALRLADRHDDARKAADRAMAVADAIAVDALTNPDRLRLVARGLLSIARLRDTPLAESITLTQQSVAMRKRLVELEPNETNERTLTVGLMVLGDLLHTSGDLDDAEKTYATAYEMRRSLHERVKGNATVRRDLAIAARALGMASYARSQTFDDERREAPCERALPYLEEAAALLAESESNDVLDARVTRDLAMAHIEIAKVLHCLDEFARETVHLAEARNRLARIESPDTAVLRLIGKVERAAAELTYLQSAWPACVEHLSKAIAALERIEHPDASDLAETEILRAFREDVRLRVGAGPTR